MGKGEFSFSLSDLMPNSWFYKFKNMRNRGKRVPKTHTSIDESPIPRTRPLKSSDIQREAPLSPHTQLCSTYRPSYYIPSRNRTDQVPLSPTHSKAFDIHFPLNSPRKVKMQPLASPVSNSQLLSSSVPLPPVLTKPRLRSEKRQSPKQGRPSSSSSASGAQQIKVKIRSPRPVNRRLLKKNKKKGLDESFVVVKSSSDPRRDFRESMVDMIVENNLCSWKEMEELLSCYLLLNSTEYHDLIVEVFEKILYDLTEFFM